MLQILFLKYVLPLLLIISATAYVTHKVTADSYKADELVATKNAIKEKEIVDEKLNDVVKSAEIVKEIQYKDREVVRIKYETITKIEPVYINSVCSLPPDGVSIINDNVKTVNSRREPTNKLPSIANVH